MSLYLPGIFQFILGAFLVQTVVLGSPIYDMESPYWEENFDPAEADPWGNITCVGSSLHIRLPMLGDCDPNGVSMQKLCAKPQYNGGARGQHAGAFCFLPRHEGSTGEVAFDLSAGAQASKELQNRRLLLTCFYRCFCNHGLTDPLVQPKSDWPYFRTAPRPSISTYELQIDVENDFTTPVEQKMGKRGLTSVDSLQLIAWTQITQPLQAISNEKHRYLSLDPGNEIVCRGNLPNFILPSPYRTSDFNNLQEMCAMQLTGGNPNANAGGYCHRSITPAGPQNTVAFSDDMTPRLEWTWDGGNFFASASIRYHCWARCACSTNHTKNNTPTALWNWIRGHEMTLREDGSMSIQPSSSNSQSSTTTTQIILPPQNGPNSPSGTCGVNGTEFCPQKWPTSLYGPVPLAPPNVTDIVPPSPPSTNLTVCGNTCTRPSDCDGSTNSADIACSCALPTPDDAHTLGIDPVAPVAVCMALFMSSMKTSRLGGRRSVEPMFVDENDVPHTCRCNETVVGNECCVGMQQKA